MFTCTCSVYGKLLTRVLYIHVHVLKGIEILIALSCSFSFFCFFFFHSVPLPEVTVSPDNLSVRYNSSFTLECRVTSFTETNITWSSTSSISKLPEPSLKVSEGGVVYTSTLQLDQVTLEHSGNYTCTAINTNGIEISDVAAVQVYSKELLLLH